MREEVGEESPEGLRVLKLGSGALLSSEWCSQREMASTFATW